MLHLFLPVSSSELLYVTVFIALAGLIVVLAWGPEDLRGREAESSKLQPGRSDIQTIIG